MAQRNLPQSPLSHSSRSAATVLPQSPMAHKSPLPHRSPMPHKSPLPQKSPNTRMPGLQDSPTIPKRRRLDLLTAALNTSYPSPFRSSLSSPTDSPMSLPWTPEASGRRNRDLLDSPDGSYLSTPAESPDVSRSGCYYKRDELWRAIKPDYQYIMKGELFEACKSTESDLSWDDDDDQKNKLSFDEFIAQYTELINWCSQVRMATRTPGMSLSEKYLNQVYHEEMLKQSPRKKCLTTYAKQLLKRYPNMKEKINVPLSHLNRMWEELMCVVGPDGAVGGEEKMLRDLEHDLSDLQAWLHEVETCLLPLCIRRHWTLEVLEEKLRDHQALQREIESHIKIVSAVLKLCERVKDKEESASNQLLAENLEKRWHAIWLQSLEWQCRLEDAINQKKFGGEGGASWNQGYPFSAPVLGQFNFSLDRNVGDDDDDDDHSDDPESDTNRDILPFSEDEYEKIPVDADTQTDPDNIDTDDAASSKLTVKAVKDKAKGELEADLSADGEKMWRSLSEAQLSEVEEVDESRAVRDVGYGSESHSNDEQDSPRKSAAGQSAKSKSVDTTKKSESAQTDSVRTASSAAQTACDWRDLHPDGEKDLQRDGDWRKDLLQDGDRRKDLQRDGDWRKDLLRDGDSRKDVRRGCDWRKELGRSDYNFSSDDASIPVLDINASPEEKFYKVAILDSDSDRIKAPSDGGNNNLAEPITLQKSSTPIKQCTSPRTRLDILLTELEHVVEESADSFHKDSPLSRLKTTDHEVRTDFAQKWNEGQTIQRLISRAEVMVDSKWRTRKSRRSRNSSRITDDSCDASSEFTESEVDYSSGLSDTEYPNQWLISSNQNASPSGATTGAAVLRTRKANSRKRERPRSMQEAGNREKVEIRPFSISESAIADLREMRTTPPRSGRRYNSPRYRNSKSKMKRSRSDSEKLERGNILSNNSSSDRTVNAGASGDNLLTTAPSIDDQLYTDRITCDTRGAGASGIDVLHVDESDTNLNSTVESFSENAWDDYQDPMYTSVNDSCLEEKLDDTHLQWEASSHLEYDDDFLHYSNDEALQLEQRNKRLSTGGSHVTVTADSDSDEEDMLHVLRESRRQLHVADTVLKKPRQDVMNTGIFLYPQKYAEVLATCQTNLNCLLDVCQTLEETDNDVTMDPNFIQFKEMISLWKEDYELALERQEQSKLLSHLYKSLQSISRTVDQVDDVTIGHKTFDDCQQLEEYLPQLQECKISLCETQIEVDDLERDLNEFTVDYPEVPMDKFILDTDLLSQRVSNTNQRVHDRQSDLQSALISLYDYKETQKELAYCLEKEASLLSHLEMNQDLLEPESPERERIREDLKTMLSDLQLYEEKLSLLQKLSSDILPISDSHHQTQIRAHTATLANQLASFRKRCRDNLQVTEPIHTVAIETVTVTTSVATQTPVTKKPGKKEERYRWLKRLMCLAIPVQCTLLFIYGLLCIGCDLSLSPQLRYVRGPPPF